MARGPRYRIPFRRRREGKTNYRSRLALLKSREMRAVVRNSLKNVRVQIVDYTMEGDRVMASAISSELSQFGWKGSMANTPAAYFTGLLAGIRAAGDGIDSAVLDIGLHKSVKGAKVYASLQGLLDAGLEIPHGDGMIPSEDRLKGEHISKEMASQFDSIKTKIMEVSK